MEIMHRWQMVDDVKNTSRLYQTKHSSFGIRKQAKNTHGIDISTLHRESKKGPTLTMAITLSILGGFAKFFHCCKEH